MKFLSTLLFTFSIYFLGYGQNWQRHTVFDDYNPGEYGYYETLNEYSTKNCPGLKESYLNWTTNESVYVLESIDVRFSSPILEDIKVMLWEFNIELEQWRCVQDKLGSDYNLGTKGVPHEDNFPGYRTSSPTWTDHDDNLWLFTGQGNYQPNTYIDLWKFDTSTKLWTFVNGAISENGIKGNYEEIGVPSPTAVPDARPSGINSASITFVDRNGDLVLFRGTDSNDMWRYNIETNQWVWLIGEDPILDVTFYDYESPSRLAIDKGVFWTDSDNNYFFLDELRSRPTWKVWKLDTENFIWSTEYTDSQTSLNLTPFREENEETIVTRLNGRLTWNQNNEYLWFFGGEEINLMYRLNLENYQWTLFNRPTERNGEEGVFDRFNKSPGFAYRTNKPNKMNLPTGRKNGLNWTKNGKFYLGYGAVSSRQHTYDIWSYNLSTNDFTLEKGSTPVQLQGFGSNYFQNNAVDTNIYYPRPYQDVYDVGAIRHGDFVYQFDASKNLYRRNMDTGINELLRERLSHNSGEVGIASEDVYPYYFKMLGVYENEIYGISSIFKWGMFKYNIETNLFTCIKEVDQTSNGPIGEFNDENFPGVSNTHYASWVDQTGNINLTRGGLFWKYSIMTKQWAITSNFTPDRNLYPKYYTLSNKFSWWLDDEGDLWVFNFSMWKYDTSEDTWELIKHGMPEVNTSNYGVQNSFSIFNNPSARMKFINWKDHKGRFWMAHGRAIRQTTLASSLGSDQRVFSDIWMFDPKIRNWVWISGPQNPINRADSIFNVYEEQPIMNVRPLSTDEDYLYHSTFAYNEDSIVTVIENCEGTIWSLDYSSLVPDYNILSGTAKYDFENNGCDSLDQGIENLQIVVDDFSAFTFTDSSGYYAQFCNEISCDFQARYNVNESEYFNVLPADTSINFGAYGQTINLDYCIAPSGDFDDVEIMMIPLDDPTFGFNSNYDIFYKNKGTTVVSGSVKMYYSKLEVSLQSFDPDTIGPRRFTTIDTIQWKFEDLKPFESRKLNAEFRIHPAMAGDTIRYTLEACLDEDFEDYMSTDNIFTLEEIVVSSFDPNDIKILEGEVLPIEQIDDYVHYRIRFENTGTAPARFIYLENFIDTEVFDVSTLTPITGSHNYISRVEEENKLFVLFEDINLSYDPEDGNKGYFLYKIKILEDVKANELLKNTAKIYFDYNEPVITEESIAMFEMLDQDQDGFIGGEDCDDNDPNVNPGQTEVPYNGIDDDCNPLTLDDDLDEDGFNLADDCDDNNSNINPNATEIPYNGFDDDCNEMTLDDDLDQDGFNLADDCDDNDSSINPDATEIPNNEIDEDCDGGDLMTSIHELAGSIINIFPNPTKDIVNINTSSNLKFDVLLFDLEGKLIYNQKNTSSINLINLPKGIYLLEIIDIKTGQKVTDKIFKD